MYNLYPVCPVFTSSGPVSTKAVFASTVCLSTAHSSVCLALKKVTPGSGDWSICLQGQKHTKINELVWVCACVCLCICISANLSSCHSSNLVSGSSNLQEYPIFTAVSRRLNEQEWERKDRNQWDMKRKSGATPNDAIVRHDTFFVPSEYPYFKSSLLKQSNSLRNTFLKSVLYRRHPNKLRTIRVQIIWRILAFLRSETRIWKRYYKVDNMEKWKSKVSAVIGSKDIICMWLNASNPLICLFCDVFTVTLTQ